MSYPRRIVGGLVGLGVLCCVVACGGVKQAVQKVKDVEEMSQLAESYRSFAVAKNGKGPNGVDEWLEFVKDSPELTALVQQCKAGAKYAFYWGVEVAKVEAPGNVVLGWEIKLPGNEGLVVMFSGEVKPMTPAEFVAADTPNKGGLKGAGAGGGGKKKKDEAKDKDK